MKRFLSFFLVALLFACTFSVAAVAASKDQLISTSVEYLEDGSYFVTDVYESAVQPFTGKTGSKSSTYYGADGTKYFVVTVNGTFSYVYGSSVGATGATATVGIYSNTISYVSKNAYTREASAYAVGTVRHLGDNITRTVVLTCDKYGNLS